MKIARIVFLFILAAATVSAAEPDTAWKMLWQPAPGKSAAVRNAVIARDRIRLTLLDGYIQFTEPLDGRSFGFAFRGRGRLQIAPPNPHEAQQLRRMLKADTLDLEFTEAAFSFTDNTEQELQPALSAGGAANLDLAELYRKRQEEREDVGAELAPRVLQGLFSTDRAKTALFAGDVKTNDKGWLHVRYDALQPEEIQVGRWSLWGSGFHGFDTWLSFPAGDRPAWEAFREPQAREPFAIRGYRIDASVGDGDWLRATSEVRLQHRVAGERVLVFELDANLRVESVRDTAAGPLPFFQPRDPKDRRQSYGDYVAVVLPQPAASGQEQTLEFKYAGRRVIRKVGDGNFFCQSYGWYPTRPESFAGRADFELNFRLPKKYLIAATGTKVNETTDGKLLVSTWKSDIPLAVAGFAFGDYKIFNEKVGDIEVEIYANRNPDDFMRSIESPMEMDTLDGPRARAPLGSLSPAALGKTMAVEMGNTLRLFQLYFGPYPYKRLAVTNIPYSYGQGWPMLLYISALSFLDSTQRNVLGITSHTRITDFFRAHESSHQWWGHRVGWKSYHDQWLSEGFAQFSGNLYVQFRKNEKEYLTRLRQDREELLTSDERGQRYESVGPVWMGRRLASADSPAAYGMVVYNKGGYILHMIRMMMFDPRLQNADQKFIAMMRAFCDTYHNRAASTEDFKAVLEKHMQPGMDVEGNGRMDWFFRQYVYGTGVPRYEVKYSVSQTGDKWKLSGSVLQSNVPEGWKDAVPLYLTVNGQVHRLGLIGVRGRETPFNVDLPIKPEKVTLNEKEDMLAEIR